VGRVLGRSGWQKARSDSEPDGPIVAHMENRVLRPTDFPPAPEDRVQERALAPPASGITMPEIQLEVSLAR
jgi:hypothetical protein